MSHGKEVVPLHQDLGGPASQVVVGGHAGSIGPSVQDCNQIACRYLISKMFCNDFHIHGCIVCFFGRRFREKYGNIDP